MYSKMFHRSRKILTLEQNVKALEMYNRKPSSHTVGEAFGVSKGPNTIQKLVKCKADVLEEYSGIYIYIY